jgi:DNA-binding NarL/FixJ family response regulator
MDNGPRNKSQIGKARHFLHCVLLEQRAAIEELKASNRELERLLEDILSTRSDLRSAGAEDALADSPAPRPALPEVPERRLVEAKREVDAVLEQGAAAIQESMRLRSRSQRIRSALRGGAAVKTKSAGQGLSKREQQVLCLIVAGKSSKEIAAELGISFKTAVTHRASIMSKLDVHEIASVVREAIRRGLV